MGRTLYDKLWDEHVVRTESDGTALLDSDRHLVQDDYVRGSAIYALAGPTGWESYEIAGPVADILRQYLAVHPAR